MVAAIVVCLCLAFRVLPHPANFAPVGAAAVFAGRTLNARTAIALVIAAMFLGDIALAVTRGYPVMSWVTPFVYGGFAVQAILGYVLRRRKGGALSAAALGSCAFFVLSNLGVWAAAGMYAHNLAGLVACYVAALPFFGATLASDVAWTAILCLAYRPIADAFSRRRAAAGVASPALAAA